MNSYRSDQMDSREVEKLWARNCAVPEATEQCIQDLFVEQARAQPGAPAICAWDGKMTYGELDGLSTRLANHLVKFGVKSENIVPLCFEKSMWTVVAMLAVLKAGGAFAPLHPDHPVSHHEEIMKQTGATVILTSAQHEATWRNSVHCAVEVSKATAKQLSVETDTIYSKVTPSNAAYVILTSGSVETPTGVVMEHRAVSTTCLGHGRAFGFDAQTRALQFASYSSDVCITEIFTTLIFGGCVCVPSEHDRRNSLSETINSMSVNWADITPTVARILDPNAIPTLKILVLRAERVSLADCKVWEDKVEVINAYGPAECCIFCTGYVGLEGFESGLIGKPIASLGWVVDPEDHNKLAPIGSVGELLVEGPILAHGFLNDAEKTNAVFIEDPTWLREGSANHQGRRGIMYKTGDLVYYGPDDNLIYVGRKDDQVKVRRQRIELGEIEHHMQGCMPEAKQIAVEAILPEGEKNNPNLAAFLQLDVEVDCALPTNKAAAAYWQDTLADCEAISFPALPPAVQQPVADATMIYQCPPLPKVPSDTTISTLVRAAWAIIASRYTNSDDVVFGATVTGRNAPVAGIEAIAEPTIPTVPVRVRVQHSDKVAEFLHSTQQQAANMIPYEQTGLHEIAKVSADAQHACNFQTLLIVQPAANGDTIPDALGEWRSRSDLQDSAYALMVRCVPADNGVQIIASFDCRAIKQWQVDKMLRQFSFVMQQLAAIDAEASIGSIDTLTPEDRQQLWEWNHDVPPAIERCIHDLFAEQARARPDAPAICAWDSDMTYGELDVLSGWLAGHLAELGVRPEGIVPLCFEKSMWTVVAMLAVLKAGGAFLLLDPSLPYERLRLMCRKVSANLSLASEASAPVARDMVDTVVVVNAESILQFAHHASPIASVRPTNTAYVIFTSGSTGEPKGCRIEHQAASSAITTHGLYLGMQASTRTLQFASYAFAGSLVELLMNFCYGGCICVPSEEERRTDLALAMCRLKANWPS